MRRLLLAAALLAVSGAASADDRPLQDPVRVMADVTPYDPGGRDAMARLLGETKHVPEVSVTVRENRGGAEVTITATQTRVSVANVTANRGNCREFGVYKPPNYDQDKFPFRLVYGDRLVLQYDCVPIELTVDHGAGDADIFRAS